MELFLFFANFPDYGLLEVKKMQHRNMTPKPPTKPFSTNNATSLQNLQLSSVIQPEYTVRLNHTYRK